MSRCVDCGSPYRAQDGSCADCGAVMLEDGPAVAHGQHVRLGYFSGNCPYCDELPRVRILERDADGFTAVIERRPVQ